jgi:hypothetical protein
MAFKGTIALFALKKYWHKTLTGIKVRCETAPDKGCTGCGDKDAIM